MCHLFPQIHVSDAKFKILTQISYILTRSGILGRDDRFFACVQFTSVEKIGEEETSFWNFAKKYKCQGIGMKLSRFLHQTD